MSADRRGQSTGWPAAVDRTERGGRGLPNERTALAWSRSGLSLAAVAALIVRFGAENDEYALSLLLASVPVVAALGAWWFGRVAYGARRDDDGGFVASPAAIRAMTGATTFAAAAAVLVTLLS